MENIDAQEFFSNKLKESGFKTLCIPELGERS